VTTAKDQDWYSKVNETEHSSLIDTPFVNTSRKRMLIDATVPLDLVELSMII